MLIDLKELASKIKLWGKKLGFHRVGVTSPTGGHSSSEAHLQTWLRQGYYGTMKFMTKNAAMRANPKLLMPEAQSIICCSLSYSAFTSEHLLLSKTASADAIDVSAPIAAFASGADYHKVMRERLTALAQTIEQSLPSVWDAKNQKFQYRVFCDSAPLLEKNLAANAGLGWIGKNTLLLDKDFGSRIVLGEIVTNLPLPADEVCSNTHYSCSLCGECTACLKHCPTKALRAAHKLDARRCIAYLTIEHRGAIPIELRPLLGTQIFGCDACQRCCPYNHQQADKKASASTATITHLRVDGGRTPCFPLSCKPWQEYDLAALFLWDEDTFVANTKGTSLQRLDHERWLRNLAVALGNAPKTPANFAALQARLNHPSELVREHVIWALCKASINL